MEKWYWLKTDEKNITSSWFRLTRDVIACAFLSFEREVVVRPIVARDCSQIFLKSESLKLKHSRRKQPRYNILEVTNFNERDKRDHEAPLSDAAYAVS